MQIYANVGSVPVRKVSKTTSKGYYEMRICESQRGAPDSSTASTWFSCRIMKDVDPGLAKGDFVKVTGKLKTDFYLSREGKPTGTLLIIAFEAAKIAKSASQSPPSAQPSMRDAGPERASARVAQTEWQD